MAAVSSIKLDTTVLDRITRELQPKAEQIVKSGAFVLEGRAKQRAPVDTGALANSITSTRQAPLLWWVHDGVEYGIYQEFGTYKMAAQPFMVPSVESFRTEFNRMLAELFK